MLYGLLYYERSSLFHLPHADEIRCECEVLPWEAVALAYPVLSRVEILHGILAGSGPGCDRVEIRDRTRSGLTGALFVVPIGRIHFSEKRCQWSAG